MHDSLAKTVSGMGFAALALARRIERDPQGAAEEARRLAEDARQATREAREIIVGLRADAGEQLPLAAALQAEARRWGAATDVRVELVGRGRRRARHRWPRASSSGSCARRWATSSATRGRTR